MHCNTDAKIEYIPPCQLNQKLIQTVNLSELIELLFSEIDRITKINFKTFFLHQEEEKILKILKVDYPELYHDLENVVEGTETFIYAKNLEQRCCREKKSFVFHNTSPKKEYREGLTLRFESKIHKTALFFPILHNACCIAVISLYADEEEVPQQKIEEVENLIKIFSPQFYTAIRLYSMQKQLDEVQGFLQKNQKLTNLSSELNFLADEEAVYTTFMEKLMHIFGFQMACIQLKNKNYLSMKYVSWTEDRHKHFLLASQEYFNQPENTHRISPEEGASAMVFLNNHHYYFEDVQPIKHLPMAPKDKKGIELAEKFHPGGLRSILIIPLVEQNLPIGILQMWALDTPVKLSDTDIAIIKKFCSFISTTIKNSQLYQQIQEKNTIIARRNHQFKEELKLAKRIQKSLIPSQPPAIPDVNFATFYKPMEEVGGDFFDFIKVREPNLLGIFISDVSGHGVPAALITSMIKTFLETAGGNRLSPSSLLSYLNENILGKLSDHFLTAFYGLYNCETKKLLYARGAHNYPLLIRKGEIIPLESKGKILGLMNDVTFEEKEIQLLAGDKILFYTDGLLDAISPDGEEFGDYIPELLLQNCHKPVNDFIEILYHSMLTFCEAYHFEDDVCMIGMEMV